MRTYFVFLIFIFLVSGLPKDDIPTRDPDAPGPSSAPTSSHHSSSLQPPGWRSPQRFAETRSPTKFPTKEPTRKQTRPPSSILESGQPGGLGDRAPRTPTRLDPTAVPTTAPTRFPTIPPTFTPTEAPTLAIIINAPTDTRTTNPVTPTNPDLNHGKNAPIYSPSRVPTPKALSPDDRVANGNQPPTSPAPTIAKNGLPSPPTNQPTDGTGLGQPGTVNLPTANGVPPSGVVGASPRGKDPLPPTEVVSVQPPDLDERPTSSPDDGETPGSVTSNPPIEKDDNNNNNNNNNNNPPGKQGIIILPPNYEKPRGNTGLRNVFKPPPLRSQQNSLNGNQKDSNNDNNEVINNNGLPVGSLVAIVICSVIGVLVILVIGGFLVKYFVGQSSAASSLIEPEGDVYYQMT